MPDKGPHFIGFEHFPPLALSFRRAPRQPGRRRKGRFFYPLGNRHPGHVREPNNAALRVALAEQGINLGVLDRFAHGRGHEQPLVAACGALVFGLPFFTAIAPNRRAAALGYYVEAVPGSMSILPSTRTKDFILKRAAINFLIPSLCDTTLPLSR